MGSDFSGCADDGRSPASRSPGSPIIFLIIGSQLRAVFLIGNNAVRGSCNQYDLHMLLQKLIRLVNGFPERKARSRLR